MSNYTKLTDFASKDSLPTGSAAKIVKGTEIDDEFDAIATSIATKAEKNNAALTGTPTAPTAASGTNTTQIATTAYVQTELSAATGSLVIDETYLDVSNTGTSGQLLSSDGDNTFTWVSTSSITQPPTMQVFTASGTWTKPTGCKTIKVIVTGGGANSVNSTTGGCAGGTAIKVIDVSAISSETVTVGAAGTTGGTSSFGSHCSATGGSASAGGVGSSGDLNLQGGQGDSGGYNSSDSAGGHGGGSFWCGTTRSESNAPANAYGCGGGGTRSSAYGTRTGTSGIVVVEEFY